MQIGYFKAPMYYIEGIPAYKTGEWTGQKSCKFGPTRRIVGPLNRENPIIRGSKNLLNLK